MNETSSGILILGGGVAGMSAALALKDQDVAVHLVEQGHSLGGHAGNWACMATTTCQNCGACLAREMAEKVRSQANLTLHLNTRLTELTRQNSQMAATLSTGQTLSPAKVIMATGFSPFDPAALPSYHTQDLDRVITTAELNNLIREETLEDIAGPAPRIAFLQCVGSRDRKQGRDYCSQVCCKISMRHARKLVHLMPGAKISLFYMDLQVIGKEARTLAAELDRDVELIQGVPAEILETDGALTMVTENPADNSRTARAFDLVVLSVGMTPAQGQDKTSALLGLTPNSWGFFNTGAAGLAEDIIPAGCAQGPKDILGAKQEGEIAAATALAGLTPAAQPPAGIAVLGDGEAALTAVQAISDRGMPVFCFGNHKALPANAQDLGTARILSIHGTTGNFTLFYEKEGKKTEGLCSAIIAAPNAELRPPDPAIKGAWDLADACLTPAEGWPQQTAILLDYNGPENKTASRQALNAAIAAARAGKQVFILMNKMLVHGPEGQKAYDTARSAGVTFLRYQGPESLDITAREKKFSIAFEETTLGRMTVALDTDALIVPGAVSPGHGYQEMAAILGMNLDREGFLQSPNVRHRLVHSPRRGIYVAGPCHDETDAADLAQEIQAILAAVALQGNAAGSEPAVAINEKKCAKCLTCYRVCPHGAIVLNEKSRPQIMPQACFACQACVSNCPAYAIDSQGFDNAAVADKAAKGRTLILACERSGALAAGDLPENTDLLAIPCACRISSDMLLQALIKGAEQIIVSSCHEGNCRSGDGSRTAARETARVLTLPAMPGDKLRCQTVAANEPRTFTRLLTQS